MQHVVDGISGCASTELNDCRVPVRDTVMQYTRKSVALGSLSSITTTALAESVEPTKFCSTMLLGEDGAGISPLCGSRT
jgi:hypothetical protein